MREIVVGEGKDLIGFATDKLLLHRLGCRYVREVDPGGTLYLSKHGIGQERRRKLPYGRVLRRPMEASARALLKALRRILDHELSALERVGIAFSGGIDSSIIAKIASETGVEVRLYAAGIPGSDDLLSAEAAAYSLQLPLKSVDLPSDDLVPELREVVLLLGSTNPMDLSIALPIFAAFRSMRADGISSVLSGQGADEIFGGYFRHLSSLRKEGYAGLSRSLRRDIVGRCIRNVGRDNRIARSLGLELLLPYLDLELLQVGLNIPPDLKILGPQDGLRKAVLREAGSCLGLPGRIVYRRKRATQYGSGSMKVIRRLAKRRGCSVREYIDYLSQNRS